MNKGVVAGIVIGVVLIASVAGLYELGIIGRQQTSTTTTSVRGTTLSYREVSTGGTTVLFYEDEVTSDVVIPRDGYVSFKNSSITFLGVKFELTCPNLAPGCPNSTSTQSNYTYNGIYTTVRITFPDGQKEIINEGIQVLAYAPKVSVHQSPRAGIVSVYITTAKVYRVYLIVTPYKGGPGGG